MEQRTTRTARAVQGGHDVGGRALVGHDQDATAGEQFTEALDPHWRPLVEQVGHADGARVGAQRLGRIALAGLVEPDHAVRERRQHLRVVHQAIRQRPLAHAVIADDPHHDGAISSRTAFGGRRRRRIEHVGAHLVELGPVNESRGRKLGRQIDSGRRLRRNPRCARPCAPGVEQLATGAQRHRTHGELLTAHPAKQLLGLVVVTMLQGTQTARVGQQLGLPGERNRERAGHAAEPQRSDRRIRPAVRGGCQRARKISAGGRRVDERLRHPALDGKVLRQQRVERKARLLLERIGVGEQEVRDLDRTPDRLMTIPRVEQHDAVSTHLGIEPVVAGSRRLHQRRQQDVDVEGHVAGARRAFAGQEVLLQQVDEVGAEALRHRRVQEQQQRLQPRVTAERR